MRPLAIACVDFWRGFQPPEILLRFPELARACEPHGLELVEDAARADLVVSSVFPGGRKTRAPRDPRGFARARGVRLFWTGENVDPDFSACDFALSFRRDLAHPRHLRVPNYVTTQRAFGFGSRALCTPPLDPATHLASKTRFCAFVQAHAVPFREEFVRKLSRYKRVDCAGPRLNNVGTTVDRRGKYALYRECCFAVTFENEAAPGYTTEKLPDALLSGCVPIYWGDPTVELDFDPGCFVRVRSAADVDDAVERVIALDRDPDAYLAVLAARRYPKGVLPPHADPDVLLAFFRRVVAVARGREAAAA